jgi:predicted RNA methylase
VALEQYPTSPHLAASVILQALEREDVGPGRTVLDLGCGTGMLALAWQVLSVRAHKRKRLFTQLTTKRNIYYRLCLFNSAMVESDFVYGVDCDEQALAIARANVVELELDHCLALVHGVVGDRSTAVPAIFARSSKLTTHHRNKRGSKGIVVTPPPPSSHRAVTGTSTTTADETNFGTPSHRFPFRRNSVDTVVCNPPFGTKRAGIDIEFLNLAW